MYSIASILRVTGIQLRRLRGDLKFWFFLCVAFLISSAVMQPVIRFASDAQVNISVMGGVVVLFNTMGFMWMNAFFIAMAAYLFADAPFLDANQEFCMIRCGKRNWIWGQILFTAALALLITLVWIASVVIVLLPRADWSLQWGTIWKTLVLTDAASAYGARVEIAPFFLRDYPVGEAFLLSIGLKFLLFALTGFVVFAGNLFSRSNAGLILGVTMGFLTVFMFNDAPFLFVWLTPGALSCLTMLSKVATGIYPTPGQAFAILVALNIALIAGISGFGRRRI